MTAEKTVGRQVVLDTETTGLETSSGHRIIEIGCVELINRKLTGNHYHQYINPEREVDVAAAEVHGYTLEMLQDKPVFSQVSDDFLQFIRGAELIIHNAPFDVGFIDSELKRLKPAFQSIARDNNIIDSLVLARTKHPGQRNSLDALCKRYGVDNSQRELHGALLDAQILADVYLLMTGGQTTLSLGGVSAESDTNTGVAIKRLAQSRRPLPVLASSDEELLHHSEKLDIIQKKSHGKCVWKEG